MRLHNSPLSQFELEGIGIEFDFGNVQPDAMFWRATRANPLNTSVAFAGSEASQKAAFGSQQSVQRQNGERLRDAVEIVRQPGNSHRVRHVASWGRIVAIESWARVGYARAGLSD